MPVDKKDFPYPEKEQLLQKMLNISDSVIEEDLKSVLSFEVSRGRPKGFKRVFGIFGFFKDNVELRKIVKDTSPQMQELKARALLEWFGKSKIIPQDPQRLREWKKTMKWVSSDTSADWEDEIDSSGGIKMFFKTGWGRCWTFVPAYCILAEKIGLTARVVLVADPHVCVCVWIDPETPIVLDPTNRIWDIQDGKKLTYVHFDFVEDTSEKLKYITNKNEAFMLDLSTEKNGEVTLKKYERLIKLYPSHSTFWGKYGETLQDLGKFDSAIKYMRKAISLCRMSKCAACAKRLLRMATVYKEAGSLGKAEEVLKEALRLYPEESDAWAGLSAIYGIQKRYKDALHAAEKALEINPGNRIALKNKQTAEKYLSSE